MEILLEIISWDYSGEEYFFLICILTVSCSFKPLTVLMDFNIFKYSRAQKLLASVGLFFSNLSFCKLLHVCLVLIIKLMRESLALILLALQMCVFLVPGAFSSASVITSLFARKIAKKHADVLVVGNG